MRTKTILQTVCLCMLFILVSCKNEKTTDKTSFLDGLTEIPNEEMESLSFEIEDVTFYNEEGNSLTQDEAMEYLNGGSFPKLYKNKSGEVSVGVLAPPSEEQKAEMTKMMAQFEEQEAKLQESVGQPLPKFNLVDYDGKEVTSSDLKGKITVINFWFKECKPCIHEMPELNELVATYKDNPNVQFIGFSTTAKDRLPSFFEKHTFDYRIVPDSMPYAIENGITGYPTNMVIDQEGNIVFLKTGFIPGIADTIKEEIENLL
ncbi:TlpA disulfide reductase family protein [uncultured Dokdonia sp.]|uniref:TlpA family protein disulfide reductase n=1 Tax=uncultured Dokdonia sp. TaxID=575653 RepID=UPI0026143FA6|nr:TlpA disulfide reductase family protein [uncultured Dokdonia sp.]